MRKTLLLSMLMVLLSTLSTFGKTGEDPVVDNRESFNIVFLSTDTSVCQSKTVEVKEGSSLNIHQVLYLKNGYELERWESKKGLTLDNISQNDTIIAYFKLIPTYDIVVISSDTTMGTVSGSGTYLEEEKVYLNYNAKDGYIFDYWYSLIDSTRFGDRIWAYRNDTVVGKFIEASAPRDTMSGVKEFSIVVLSADTTQGIVWEISEKIKKGQPIDLYAKANYGYALDYWKSVNGFPIDTVVGNDTIYAYFRELPKYTITVVSEDTTKGVVVSGGGIYAEGKFITSERPLVLLHEGQNVLIVNSNDGYKFDYWKTNMGEMEDLWDYMVTGNDTIVAYFRKDTTPSDPVIDFPQARLYVWVERLSRVDFYGNMLQGMKFSDEDDAYDSLVITNKKTGITDTISGYDDYYLTLGDTISFFIITKDDFKSDSVYTVTYTDPSQKTIYENISLYNKARKIELTEAEGDSFNVNIVYKRKLYNSSIVVKEEWEGNGRYAKGDTIYVVYDGIFLATNIDENVEYFELPKEMKFVVNNDIDILFFSFADQYLIDVDQITAEIVEDAYVNVYTINGHLLKQHVLKEEALDGLRKGLYIVGGKKVYVKN